VTVDPIARLDHPTARVLLHVGNQTEANYRAHACAKEPWTAEFIGQMPQGSVFYDCGANVGSYALLAAALGHAVVAVEPAYPNYARLCQNAARNDLLSRIVALPLALGDTVRMDWLQLRSLEPGIAMHVLGQPPGQKPMFWHRQAVPVAPLDWLVETLKLPPPTHIKLDVDGAESAALTGMEACLRAETFRGLMVEIRNDQEKDVVARLNVLGLQQVGRYAERGGKPIADLSYGHFVRAA